MATAYMASVSFQGVYWSKFKHTFQKDGVKWQCSVDTMTQPTMHFIIPWWRGVPKRSSAKLQREATYANSSRCSTTFSDSACQRQPRRTAVADFHGCDQSRRTPKAREFSADAVVSLVGAFAPETGGPCGLALSGRTVL